MAEQTINLPNSAYIGGFTQGWIFTVGRPQVDSEFVPTGDLNPRYLAGLSFSSTGEARLGFTVSADGADLANADLTSAFETMGGFSVTAGSETLDVNLAGVDLAEPYNFTPDNSDEVIAFRTHVIGLSDRTATLVLRDFTPIAPRFEDATGDPITATVGDAIASVTVPEARGVTSGNEQTIALAAGWYSEAADRVIYEPQTGSRPLIDASLSPAMGTRYLRRLIYFDDGRVALNLEFTQTGTDDNFDLSSTWEANGTLQIDVGSLSLTVAIDGADPTEEYVWTPSNSAEVSAFVNAVHALAGDSHAGTLVIRDFDADADPNPLPTYAAVGTLPTGVSFNTTTRVLSFDENAITAGMGVITIRASNSQGTADWTVSYTFEAGSMIGIGDTLIENMSIGSTPILKASIGDVDIFG